MAINITDTIDDVVATTYKYIQPSIVDNFNVSHPAITAMIAKHNVKLRGGDRIQQPVQIAEPPGDAYGDGDELDISRKTLFSALTFDWKMYQSAITIEGIEEIKNGGKEAVIDMVAAKMATAREQIESKLGQDFFLDGTRLAGKTITGLAAAFDDGNTVANYGQVSRSTTEGALLVGTVNSTGGSLTLSHLTDQIMAATRGTKQPDLIVTTRTLWGKVHDRLQVSQRFPMDNAVGKALANAGFRTINWMGANIVHDDKCPSGYMWFINTDSLKLYIREGRFFEPMGPFTSANRDQKVYRLHWAGELVCDQPRLNAVSSGLS